MTGDSAHRGGLSMREYKAHVWDMARHQLHPAFLYVAAQVAAATRLLGHAAYADAGGGLRETALFAAGFLGAWACFWSTLLRVSGLRSLTVTILVPLAVLAALAVWFAFPAPAAMSRAALLGAELALVGPGLIGFPLTYLRWRAARREAAEILRTEPAE